MTNQAPSERYSAALAAHGYSADAAQERALESLDRVWKALQEQASTGLLERLRARLSGEPAEKEPARGLYMWGGVGRGKTFLMDQFFHALPFEQKQRLHFHRFMQQVHSDLKTLKQTEDPLRVVARRVADRARVICFDEFFVSDIADAMILGRLFEHLFRYGVTLVATSNIPPGDLYRDGLQRARFLPAISLLQHHCEVLNVEAGTDYRLRQLQKAEIYHSPLDDEADRKMAEYFRELGSDEERDSGELLVNGRTISAKRLGEGVAWFTFESLCGGPRAAADYIEIAREFHTVLLSGVPQLDWSNENEARRFVTLIDEFYDRHVKLILSAKVEARELYVGEKLKFEFQRTLSRLQEMASRNYLALPHRP